MSRFRMLLVAVISWLALFSVVSSTPAQVLEYNVASDWLSTYPTSASLKSATTATWGPAFAGHAGWSAGSMSSNWSNSPIVLSPTYSSATQNGVGYDTLATYYKASTGYLTSGTASASFTNQVNVATYTYTVPFQTYQLNPGATISMNMGITTTEQLASAFTASAGEKVTLPTSWTNTGAGSGVVQGVAAVESIPSAGTTAGFTTTAFNIQKSFSDGQNGNTVPDVVPGVFYNYGVDGSSKFDPLFSVASSGSDNVVTLNASLGPAYVAWTAPEFLSGPATVSATFWDTSWSSSDNNGAPSYFIFNSNQLGANGPTSFMMSALDLANVGNGNPVGGRGVPTSNVTNGSLVSQLDSTYSAANGAIQGVNYTANLTVSPGETIYFVVDPTRTDGGQHSFEGGQDMVALKATVSLIPEPSSFVLFGVAGVGLALAAWRRRLARPNRSI